MEDNARATSAGYDTALAIVEKALEHVRPERPEGELELALATIRSAVAEVAEGVAEFVNALDDGTGASNTTAEFGQALAAGVDREHRVTLAMALGGFIAGDDHELLRILRDMAEAHLAAKSAPAPGPMEPLW